MMKKALSLLSALCLILSLFSCGTPKINEEEFLTRAGDVLRRAETINRIFLTKEGIPVKKDGFSSGKYKAVDTAALSAMGFSDFDGIQKESTEIFSTEAYTMMMRYVSRQNDIQNSYTRYIEWTDKEDPSVTYFMAYTDVKDSNVLSDDVSFDLSTLKIVKTGKNRKGEVTVTVTVDEKVIKTKDGEKEEKNFPASSFTFVLENGVYKLDDLVARLYDAE